MSSFASWAVARRAATARLVLALAFALLVAAFFRAQVLRSASYRLESESSRLRAIPLPAPRGEIVDRNGLLIAENAPGYTIRLLASRESDLRDVLARLQALVPGHDVDVDDVVARWRAAPFIPALVFGASDFALVSRLEEHRAGIPGLVIQAEPRRRYPDSTAVAHLTGYSGEISQAELGGGGFRGARMGEIVGKLGLELEYDSLLRGSPGVRSVEVTARGRLVRDPGQGRTVLPVAGRQVRTTIDLPLQRFVDSMWRAAPFLADKRGALVAMRPDGAVLAYYSHPSFDPNAFIGGISSRDYALLRDDPNRPMYNRVINGAYPPASPYKLAVAAMALKRGLVTMETRMPLPCSGAMIFGTRRFRCWKPEGHGVQDLRGAIATSCDVYFYQLGLRLSADSMLADGHAFGFGEATGIDLPHEQQPTLYQSTQDYVRRRGAWTRGETLNLAIGQGANAQTLVGMTAFYAALASDGVKRAPYLVARPTDAPIQDLGVSAAHLEGLRLAMSDVVTRGTAGASGGAVLDMAGKTGTGQMPGGQEDIAWFIGFAPTESPQIVIGILVEEGEHGSSVAPYVVQVIRRWILGPDPEAILAPIDLPITENLGDSDDPLPDGETPALFTPGTLPP
jgi:penicillin-binding protein 2